MEKIKPQIKGKKDPSFISGRLSNFLLFSL